MLNIQQVNKINRKQNKIIKTLTITGKTKINNTYKDLKILKFPDIIELELAKLIYKIKNNFMTSNIKNIIDNTP